MLEMEIVAVKCHTCRQMVEAQEAPNHLCWLNPIELHDDEYEAWMANEQRKAHERGEMASEWWQGEMAALEATLSTDDTEEELQALERLDQYLAGDEEENNGDD